MVYRRIRGDMIEMFKMVSGGYDEQVMPAIATAEEAIAISCQETITRPRRDNTTSGKG